MALPTLKAILDILTFFGNLNLLFLSIGEFCEIIYLMSNTYKFLHGIGSPKNIIMKLLVLLFLIALAYWMITGFIFTLKLLLKTGFF
jgi:hypothetical protein